MRWKYFHLFGSEMKIERSESMNEKNGGSHIKSFHPKYEMKMG